MASQRIFFVLILAMTAVLLLLTPQPSYSKGIPTNMGMDHIGFTVPNTQDAADFLIDMFDCVFDWEVKRDPTPNAGERGWAKLFNIHPESYLPHVMMLKCGDYHLTQYIELFEWSSPDQVTWPAENNYWPKFSDIGNGYLSFTVKNIHRVLDHVKSKMDKYPTVKIIQDPPMDFPLRGETCTSTFIISPWGQWIELTQWSISGPKGKVIKALRDEKELEKEKDLDCLVNCMETLIQALGDHFNKKESLSMCLTTCYPQEFASVMAGDKHQEVHAQPVGGATEYSFGIASKTPATSVIGKSILEVETPALFVDLDVIDYNVKILTDRTKAKNVNWRPPVKAHKCPGLANYLISLGAEGVVVLTLEEAEVFANNGVEDIYIANQFADPSKLERVAKLASRVSRIRVAIDDEENLRAVAAAALVEQTTIEVLVEININHNRTGVRPEDSVRLAKIAKELEDSNGGIRFAGITGYEGHTPVLPPDDKTRETKYSHSILAKAKELIEAAGIHVEVVSGGGSSNYIDALNTGVLTELQAGGAALNDLLYLNKAGLINHGHRYALFLLSQVISVSKEGERAMGDAGFKTTGWHPFGGYPQPFNRTDIEVWGLSAEHLKIRPTKEGSRIPLKRGDKVVLVPGYGDAIGFLHRKFYAVRGGVVRHVWPTLSALLAPSE